jgi:carboxypeptidase Taq
MVINVQSSYRKLLEKSKSLVVLGSAEAMISWDMETMMPPRGVYLRSEQLSLLSQIHHKMGSAPATGKLLNSLTRSRQYETLSEVEKRNVHLIKKNYDEQTKLPSKLVAEIAKQQAITVNIWKKAKATKNYAVFKPELEKLVAMNQKAAEILMKVKQTKTPYDALVDIFEPKMTSGAINKIFAELQQGLKILLAKIETAPNQSDASVLCRQIPLEKQREIAKGLAQTLGYDFTSSDAAGRIDETEHPFTTGYYDDVRITTHYYSKNFASSIFSVLHETGHALYEQGLPQEWKYQPVGSACSSGLHESQSRLYENLIGRSTEFWTTLLPKMKAIASPNLEGLKLREFINAINAVKPSKIRIESDEVTYSLHIIIRFQMEKDLFAGKINVDELPAVWNQKYKEILGVTVENDAEGVMQDTHWASGLYGYFPSYALGNIYTGQILNAIQQSSPNWRTELAAGNLGSIRTWLNSNIYRRGNLYDPAELIKKATGTELTVKPYLQYLEEKYRERYNF